MAAERGLRFDEVQSSPPTERPSERAKTLSAAPRSSVRRDAFLANVGEVLGASIEIRATARALASLAVPALGDEAIVDLLQHDGRVRRFVATELFVSEDPKPIDGDPASDEIISSGRTSIVPGAIHAPLEARGRVIGLLSVFSGADRRLGDLERELIEELARRGGVALNHAFLVEDLREAIKRRDEAIALVAHDLTTPLKKMQINAMRLLRELDQSPMTTRRIADDLRRAAERLRHHAADLLDLEAIDGGRVRLQVRHHDPVELLGEALDVVQPIASEKQLRIETAVHHHRAVPCDRERFVQVLTSILGSAIKLAPEAAIVGVSLESVGREALFRVSDGGGIPIDETTRVFDRDWRAPSKEPIGLTLAVAKGMVEAHGGRAWIEREDRGAAFCFTVPYGDSTRPPQI